MLGQSTENAKPDIRRKGGESILNKNWQRYLKSEEELLRKMYPNAPKAEIVKALPGRTWVALRRKGEKMGLKRVFREHTEETKQKIRDTLRNKK